MRKKRHQVKCLSSKIGWTLFTENNWIFFAKVSKNVLKLFLRKLVSSKMNQESIGSKSQVDLGVNQKDKIPQSFLEPIESLK